MAEGASPLRFPTAKEILGENAPSPPPAPAPVSADAAALQPSERSARPQKHPRRPSTKDNAKRCAQKKDPVDPAAAAVKEGSVVKPKQTKSRNGCATCKTKRLKCGEEKPGCLNCAKRGQVCGGYKKQFQWRDYGTGANGQVKINPDTKPTKQVPSNVIVSPLRDASAVSSQSSTPTAEVPPNLSHARTPSTGVPSRKRASSPAVEGVVPNGAQVPKNDDDDSRRPGSARQDSAFTSPQRDQPDPAPPPDSSDHLGPPDAISFPLPSMAYRLRSISPGFRPPSPSLTELMQADIANHDPSNRLDFVPFSMPDDMQLPAWAKGVDHQAIIDESIIDEDIDLIGPIHPTDMLPFLWPSQYSSPSPSANPSDSQFGWHDPMHDPMLFLLQQPELAIDHTAFLEDRFKLVTCGILSIMDGPNENPWRNLVWPLTERSAGLYHALLAMAAFHSAQDIPALRPIGNEHKAASIRHIRDGLRDDSMSTHVALATALALGFAEAWDRHTDTGNLHIMGAQAMVKKAIEQHHQSRQRGIDLARLKFLCNAWVYMDVIARLTSLNSNESNDFDKALWVTDDREMAMGNEEPGFGINFGMPIDARLDPLMGCAGTLFPMIGRVANLVRKVCRSQKNSPGIISQARDLMDQIEHWDPPAYIERPEDPTTDVQHALQTAEAYRYATLLHLHQAVPELPSPFSDEQYAQRVLQYLATVPLSSRTINVHIYPMMVGGCQASESEDREWVRQRWGVMKDRMRIGIIDKCLAITEEVWRRKDEYEAKPARQRKLVATADLNPTRRRGGPPDGNGSQSPQPGRNGVVFSYIDTEGDAPNQKNHHDMNRPGPSRPARINDSDLIMGKIDMAYTVRGHLHWVGVMWDWGWEVLLG